MTRKPIHPPTSDKREEPTIDIKISKEDVRLVARVAYEQRTNAMNTTDTYALREFSVRLCNAKHAQVN